MATELAKAYVQIVPSATGISGSIQKTLDPEAKSAGKSAGSVAGSGLASGIKNALVGLGIGAVVTKGIKAALDEGGKLQQSYGGLDTIYGEASETAKEYAIQAAQAGISANDYAENAVSFGAALKQAYGGDTAKAVEAANTAILDMTDNAAKMGTPIESVQQAYQGFAKGQYQLLDNLKIGYGGTKTEMERLLADASKLSGQEYDISNLGDVYDAIHVIQEDLGLTGVAAAEASETFSGSFGAMQAAGSNLLGALALGEGVDTAVGTFVQSVGTFLFNNLIPMVGDVLKSLPTAFKTAIDAVIPAVQGMLPGLISAAVGMVRGFLDGARTQGPAIIAQGGQMVNDFINGLLSGGSSMASTGNDLLQQFLETVAALLPSVLETGFSIISNLVMGIIDALPDVITAASETFAAYIDTASGTIPQLLDIGIEAVLNLVNGIIESLPSITGAALQAVSTLLSSILDNAPQLLQAGIQLVVKLVQGLLNSLPNIAKSALQIVVQVATTIGENLPKILQTGAQLIGQLLVGIVNAVPQILGSIPGILSDIGGAFLEYDWLSIGRNIIQGIANGLKNAGSTLVNAAADAAASALQSAKNFLGIESPSKVFRDEVGAMMAKGMAIGFEDNIPTANITGAIGSMTNAASNAATPATVGATIINNITVSGAENPEDWAIRFARQMQIQARMA